MPAYVKVAGVWKNVATPYVKVAGVHKAVDTAYVKVAGAWDVAFSGVPPLAPGTYVLPTTAGGGGFAFVEADTTPYRGRITAVVVRISYGSPVVGIVTSVTGRPNGNFYRNITGDNSWSNRTISHRCDTFDPTALTDFNNGDAIGFTFGNMQASHNNSQVELTIS